MQEMRLTANELGFGPKKKGELDLILAELVSNLVKYGTDGELLVRPMLDSGQVGIEIISVDSGPGMANPEYMLEDGVSMGGSLGQGLGAIRRLSDEFQLYSQPGKGTVVLVRIYQRHRKKTLLNDLADVRWISVAKPGETVCGDACYCKLTTSSLKLFLGDGLGHGALAKIAVDRALEQLKQSAENSPAKLLTAVHQGATGTRGLVGTCAIFDFVSRKWTLCGVGNITTRLSGSMGVKGYIAHNGILGYILPQLLQDQEMPYERGQWLIMASDGLHSRWNPARYPGIGTYDPSVLAAVIYKEYAHRTDDMSILVSKLY